MNSFSELSWDDAHQRAWSATQQLNFELLPIASLADRTLAQDCFALCELPRYTTSAMDGWAVAGIGPWKITGEIKAGQPLERTLQPGTSVAIATGAVIPDGTLGVLRRENAHEIDGYIHGQVSANLDIRPSGEECQKGDLLISRGQKLSPTHLGLLAATGYDEAAVIGKPKIALLLLGDELQLSGIPANGLVRDSLGPQLPHWIEKLGGEVISQSYVTDELGSVISAISDVIGKCDLIITTGGTADGPRDHVHAALAANAARFIVDRVRSRPGHPALLAEIASPVPTLLLGLPGNPQSAIVGLMTLGAPVIATFLGQTFKPLRVVQASDDLNAPPDFTRLVLGNLIQGRFAMGEHLGSAMLRGLANSSGFGLAPSGVTKSGAEIRWLPLP